MAAILSSGTVRRARPAFGRLVRWLDEVGAPLLLAAIIAVMVAAAYEMYALDGAPEITVSRNLAA